MLRTEKGENDPTDKTIQEYFDPFNLKYDACVLNVLFYHLQLINKEINKKISNHMKISSSI